jgi:hypothetical protein
VFRIPLALASYPPLTKNELRAAAHHEAGHAVAAMVLDFWRPVERVIVGRHTHADGSVVDGAVRFGNDNVPLASLPRDQLLKDAVLTYAGPLAEIFDQQHRKNRELENQKQYWQEGGAHGDTESAHATCIAAAARDHGVTLKCGDYIPLAVRQSADKLCEETFEQAGKLIEEHWHHIRKLAIALQERRRMTGEQIWDLLTAPEAPEAPELAEAA